MEPTVFHRIIAGELPVEVVYENEEVLAFLDAAPNHPGHTLIIPKKPSRNIFDIDESSWLALAKATYMLAPLIRNAVNAEGINIHMNNEAAADQAVFYTHVHLIPRYSGDGFVHFPPGEYREGEKKEVAEKIRALLT